MLSAPVADVPMARTAAVMAEARTVLNLNMLELLVERRLLECARRTGRGITRNLSAPCGSRPLDPCGAPALRVDELAPHGTARAQRVAGLALEKLAIGAVLPRRISRIF